MTDTPTRNPVEDRQHRALEEMRTDPTFSGLFDTEVAPEVAQRNQKIAAMVAINRAAATTADNRNGSQPALKASEQRRYDRILAEYRSAAPTFTNPLTHEPQTITGASLLALLAAL